MAKLIRVTDKNGNERDMYLQEEGSVVSKVSPYKNSSWKTEENVFNNSIKEFKHKEIEEDPRDNTTVYITRSDDSKDNYDSHHDPNHDDFNSSNSCDDWVSNCGGADIPDHIDPDTAHFDEEGNYSGGTMIDLNED